MVPEHMNTTALIFAVVSLLFAGFYAWRLMDHLSDRREAARLRAIRTDDPAIFKKSELEGLPEPARRYFEFAIAEGTPLFTVAEISMQGQFGTGDKEKPNYMPMRAEQLLAAPYGFVWRMSGGSSGLRISGSDSASWTRFWVAGLVPVARSGGTSDHSLSAFGRCISEAVFWTPAAVLPGPGISWEYVDENRARVTVTQNGNRQSVVLKVAADGRPVEVEFQRWSNANADKEYRLQPFGGYLSDFRTFSGFQLPTHVEAGNFFGTDDYFPFFIADVTDVRFVH